MNKRIQAAPVRLLYLGICLVMLYACKFGNNPEDAPLYPEATETTFHTHDFTDTGKKVDSIFTDTIIQYQILPVDFDPEDLKLDYNFYDTVSIMTYDILYGIDTSIVIRRHIRKEQNGEVRDTLDVVLDIRVNPDTLVIVSLDRDTLMINEGLIHQLDFDTLFSWTIALIPAESDTMLSGFHMQDDLTGDSLLLQYKYIIAGAEDHYAIDTVNTEITSTFWRESLHGVDSLKFYNIDTLVYLDTSGLITFDEKDTLPLIIPVAKLLLDDPDNFNLAAADDSLLSLLTMVQENPTEESALFYPEGNISIAGMGIMADSAYHFDSTVNILPWQWQLDSSDTLSMTLVPDSAGLLGNWSGIFKFFSSEAREVHYQQYNVTRIYKEFYPEDLNLNDFWNLPENLEMFGEDRKVFSLRTESGSGELQYFYYTRVGSKFALRGDFQVSLQVDLRSNLDFQYGAAFFLSNDTNPISIYYPDIADEFTVVLNSTGFVINGNQGINNLKIFSNFRDLGNTLTQEIRSIPDDPFLELERVADSVSFSYYSLENTNKVLIGKANVVGENLNVFLMSMVTKEGGVPFTVDFKQFHIEKGDVILNRKY